MYCEQLIAHKSENHPEIGSTKEISDDIIMAIYNFAKWFLKAFDKDTSSEKSVETSPVVTAEEVRTLLEKFLRFQEAFVTPEDIYSNSTNLDNLGVLTYSEEDIAEYNTTE